jgi:hypothetical protein
MDKIFSARLEESALQEMDRVTRLLKLTKKKFLEEAIHARAEALQASYGGDVWEDTRGAWKRKESPAKTVEKARIMIEASYHRHHGAR